MASDRPEPPPPESMQIVAGMADLTFAPGDLSPVAVLAAAAVACMAAIGNGDAAEIDALLRCVVTAYGQLSKAGEGHLGLLADEIRSAALAHKAFVLIGATRFKVEGGEAD